MRAEPWQEAVPGEELGPVRSPHTNTQSSLYKRRHLSGVSSYISLSEVGPHQRLLVWEQSSQQHWPPLFPSHAALYLVQELASSHCSDALSTLLPACNIVHILRNRGQRSHPTIEVRNQQAGQSHNPSRVIGWHVNEARHFSLSLTPCLFGHCSEP